MKLDPIKLSVESNKAGDRLILSGLLYQEYHRQMYIILLLCIKIMNIHLLLHFHI